MASKGHNELTTEVCEISNSLLGLFTCKIYFNIFKRKNWTCPNLKSPPYLLMAWHHEKTGHQLSQWWPYSDQLMCRALALEAGSLALEFPALRKFHYACLFSMMKRYLFQRHHQFGNFPFWEKATMTAFSQQADKRQLWLYFLNIVDTHTYQTRINIYWNKLIPDSMTPTKHLWSMRMGISIIGKRWPYFFLRIRNPTITQDLYIETGQGWC